MGKKLTVYMIDGTEYGPRIAEIGNWSGKAVYGTRATISKILKREEFNNPGVYCLKSEPNDDGYDERIYIGEAEVIGNRLKQHLNDPDKDFSEFVFFISKDDLLTKSHIRYLESRMVEEAFAAKSAEVANGNKPSKPTLHEADIDDMEYFMDQIKLILPVMGFRFLVSSVVQKEDEFSSEMKGREFTIKSKHYDAVMYESDQGFIVKKGSKAKKELMPSLSETYIKLRHKLLQSGSLVESGDELEFTEDTIFTSVSAASNMILGRQSAGPLEWLDEKGRTFKELTEMEVNSN